MHTEMWEHPATVDNVATLRRRGAIVLEPASGRLTGADTGKGRLPEPAEIAALAELLLRRPDALPVDLAGRHVVVSAGGTREPLDPVRFLGNALLRQAGLRGRRGRRRPRRPGHPGRGQRRAARPGRRRRRPRGAPPLELRDAVHKAAARRRRRRHGGGGRRLPSRPTSADHKIKKYGGGAAADRADREPGRAGRAGRRPAARARCSSASPPRPATTTATVLEHGRAKLARKGCDLLVVNAVGPGKAFGQADNAA